MLINSIKAFAVAILSIFLCGCISTKPTRAVLAVDSSACHCVKNRCANMETELNNFISENNLSEVTELNVYDNFKNSSTKEIMDKYQMGLFPYIVLVDKKDEVRYRASAFEFNKDKLKEAIITAAEEEKAK